MGRLTMKQICQDIRQKLIGSGGIPRYVEIPCGEGSLLYLERVCMTPGFHHIVVESLTQGCTTIATILRALAWHQDAAWVGVDQSNGYKSITNIIRHIEQLQGQEQLDHFFITSFYYDFFLIAWTPALQAQPYWRAFYAQLNSVNLPMIIPIIVMQEY